jgi:cell division septal protein FtsQ
MLLATGALWWLLGDAGFRVRPEDVTITGTRLASRDAVLARLVGIERSPNVLRLRGDELLVALREMPEVRAASLGVSLPSQVRVDIEEREPIFAWTDGEATWLVDREGVLFAEPATAGATTTLATGRHEDALPTVRDDRLVEAPLEAGTRLNPVDLSAMTQLLSLEPELLGSDASELTLRIDESLGYVLSSPDRPWRAYFGHYTPTLYEPARIPVQVHCLAAIVGAREAELGVVRLVPSEEACGTFTTTGSSG